MLETSSDLAFLLGRVVFGGVLAFMGINHFLSVEEMTGYADAKGVPFPRVGVIGSGVALLIGGVGLAVGVAPNLAGGLILGFFVVVTPVMHDFWTVSDPEQRQQEMTDFLKNAALAGTALVFIALSAPEWPLAVSV